MFLLTDREARPHIRFEATQMAGHSQKPGNVGEVSNTQLGQGGQVGPAIHQLVSSANDPRILSGPMNGLSIQQIQNILQNNVPGYQQGQLATCTAGEQRVIQVLPTGENNTQPQTGTLRIPQSQNLGQTSPTGVMPGQHQGQTGPIGIFPGQNQRQTGPLHTGPVGAPQTQIIAPVSAYDDVPTYSMTRNPRGKFCSCVTLILEPSVDL